MTDYEDVATIRHRRFEALERVPLTRLNGGQGAVGGGWAAVKDVFRNKEMLDLIVRRDLKARYKDSSLGFFWTLVRPIVQLIIYYVVLGHFLGAARGIPDFAIYIYAGLTIFTLFSEIVLGGAGSIVANAGLVKKIYLPREIFPLASVGSAMFNFGIQLLILIAATIAFGAFPWHAELLYAIPAVLIVVLYGTALGLLLSAANVYFRDIQYLIEVVMMLLMWASPILYSWTMVRDAVPAQWMLDVYTDNPLTLAVLGFQQAFWVAGGPDFAPEQLLLRMLIAIFIGLFLVVGAHAVFRRLQGDFAQAL
jgi:ABC-2 type transport system permease protein